MNVDEFIDSVYCSYIGSLVVECSWNLNSSEGDRKRALELREELRIVEEEAAEHRLKMGL